MAYTDAVLKHEAASDGKDPRASQITANMFKQKKVTKKNTSEDKIREVKVKEDK